MGKRDEYAGGDDLEMAAADDTLAEVQSAALVGKLVVLQLDEETTWNTEQGPETPVSLAYVYEVDPKSGELIDHDGLVPFFWTAIRNAMRRAQNKGKRRITGRIVQQPGKGGRTGAYVLVPPSPEEWETTLAAVTKHEAF